MEDTELITMGEETSVENTASIEISTEGIAPVESAVEDTVSQEQEPELVDTAGDVAQEFAEEVLVLVEEPVTEVATPQTAKKITLTQKTLIIIGGSIAATLIAFLILLFTIIQPNSIYDQAKTALRRGDFEQCEQLLKKIPNHKGTHDLSIKATVAKAQSYIDEGELDVADSLLIPITGNEEATALRQEIQYLRAADLVAHEEYQDALLILDKIPNHEDPRQLREKINYATALASVETGDYKTAYELFSQLGDFEDSAKQKEIVYYEALAFKSLFNIQATLKNPASMYITKVTFYKDSSTEGELDAVYEFNATNSYGGSLGAYGYDLSLYNDSEDSGMISQSAYASPDDYVEVLYQMLIDSIRRQTVLKTSVDVARMNRLLSGNVSFNIDLPFQSADIVDS